MLERFGFTGDRLTARIGDLSGGERRRFQLLRLLLTEPNVLLLDEPTNDLDIETLTVLEDFLDGWPGTLVVVSHDRYFLERVTDVRLGAARRRPDLDAAPAASRSTSSAAGSPPRSARRTRRVGAADDAEPVADRAGHRADRGWRRAAGSAEERAARKALARVEKQLERVAVREAELNAARSDARPRLRAAARAERDRAPAVAAEREALELEWLEAAEDLE